MLYFVDDCIEPINQSLLMNILHPWEVVLAGVDEVAGLVGVQQPGLKRDVLVEHVKSRKEKS